MRRNYNNQFYLFLDICLSFTSCKSYSRLIFCHIELEIIGELLALNFYIHIPTH
jgi:hypothetical protein